MVISLTPLIVLDLEYFSENISTPSMLPIVSNHLCQTNLLLYASFQSYRLIFYKLIQQANSRVTLGWLQRKSEASAKQSSSFIPPLPSSEGIQAGRPSSALAKQMVCYLPASITSSSCLCQQSACDSAPRPTCVTSAWQPRSALCSPLRRGASAGASVPSGTAATGQRQSLSFSPRRPPC